MGREVEGLDGLLRRSEQHGDLPSEEAVAVGPPSTTEGYTRAQPRCDKIRNSASKQTRLPNEGLRRAIANVCDFAVAAS